MGKGKEAKNLAGMPYMPEERKEETGFSPRTEKKEREKGKSGMLGGGESRFTNRNQIKSLYPLSRKQGEKKRRRGREVQGGSM